jgi:hypothetical protein
LAPLDAAQLQCGAANQLLLFSQGPVFLADFVQALASGASFGRSLSTALLRSLFLLPLFTLPVVAFAALTRNLTEAIAGAVVPPQLEVEGAFCR